VCGIFASSLSSLDSDMAAIPTLDLSCLRISVYFLQCRRKWETDSGLWQCGHNTDSAALFFLRNCHSATCPVRNCVRMLVAHLGNFVRVWNDLVLGMHGSIGDRLGYQGEVFHSFVHSSVRLILRAALRAATLLGSGVCSSAGN